MPKFRFNPNRWLLCIALLLGACASPPTPSATPLPRLVVTHTPERVAVVTPTQLPSATSTAPATPTPQPAVALPHYHFVVHFDDAQHLLTVAQTITYTNPLTTALTDLLLVVEPNRQPGVFHLTDLAWADSAIRPTYAISGAQLQ